MGREVHGALALVAHACMIRVCPPTLMGSLLPLRTSLDVVLGFMTLPPLLEISTETPSFATLRHLRVSIEERRKDEARVAEEPGKF